VTSTRRCGPARAGPGCVLVQESWVDWPDPVYDKVGNILISRLAGAGVRLVRAGFGIGVKESTVLYAHLGGQPALNAYSALFD
jgi:1-aminocyclopropane-1-carboxylate deaminase/D-cysteine desulfhydrase-like pyridoxal-dependent ACC family enzyme